jgi:hypothetical protein
MLYTWSTVGFGNSMAKGSGAGFSEVVENLKVSIDAFLKAWNKDPNPFVWIASVESITEKLSRCLQTLKTIQPGAQATNQKGKEIAVHLFRKCSFHAFLYSNGQMIDLGTLPGWESSFGESINTYGEVTGVLARSHNAPFIWRDRSCKTSLI